MPMATRRNIPMSMGGAERLIKRLAAGIFEHQHRSTAVVHEFERLGSPRGIQLNLQSEFVGEAIEV